jgi:hypothetical protein
VVDGQRFEDGATRTGAGDIIEKGSLTVTLEWDGGGSS